MILFFAWVLGTSLLASHVGSVDTRRGDLLELLRDRECGVRGLAKSDIFEDMDTRGHVWCGMLLSAIQGYHLYRCILRSDGSEMMDCRDSVEQQMIQLWGNLPLSYM